MAGRPKGQPKTGGRVKGTPNKASAAFREKASASGLLPHEFLLAVARGEIIDGHRPEMKDRLFAANAAAPYYAPKLSAIEHSGANGGPIETRDLTSLERAKALAVVLARAGA